MSLKFALIIIALLCSFVSLSLAISSIIDNAKNRRLLNNSDDDGNNDSDSRKN